MRQQQQQQVSWLIVVVSCLASLARAEDVECMYERRVEDFTATTDPDDAYDNEYGVCTTVAGSGRRLADGTGEQPKTLYITEPEDVCHSGLEPWTNRPQAGRSATHTLEPWDSHA